MTVNAAKHYLNRYGVLTGKDIVIATNNDSVYNTADLISQAGANVIILDSRKEIKLDKFNNNIQVKFETVPYSINGSRKIKSIDIADAKHQPYTKIDQYHVIKF